MAIKNHFANAFIRQLGRETAHSLYQDITQISSDIKSVNGNFNVKLKWFKLVIDAVIGIIPPIIMFIPLVRGIKRLKGEKINGYVNVTKSTYTTDRRYRGGRRYVGDVRVDEEIEIPRNKCKDEIIDKYEHYDEIEIIFSISYMFCWILWICVANGIF